MAQKELKRAKAAAIKIQAMYRGYSTRKALQALRDRKDSMGVINYELNLKPVLLVSEIVEEMVANSCADEKVCKSRRDSN